MLKWIAWSANARPQKRPATSPAQMPSGPNSLKRELWWKTRKMEFAGSASDQYLVLSKKPFSRQRQESSNEELSRLTSLDEVPFVDLRLVSIVSQLSSRGNIRRYKPTPAGSNVDWRKFGGGMRSPYQYRVGPICADCVGIC